MNNFAFKLILFCFITAIAIASKDSKNPSLIVKPIAIDKKDFADPKVFFSSTPNIDANPNPKLRTKAPIPVHLSNDTVGSLSYGWVEYKQCGGYWANQRLGWCDEYTICTAGCAMTSTAMILATRGVAVDPSSLDEWLSNNGGYYDGATTHPALTTTTPY
jgi:hypothetical protein